MSDPFYGEIRMFGFTFAPRDWAFCNGQLLSISQYSALYSLLGTYYGGDGRSTFGLPHLRGRVPMHFGQGPGLTNYPIGYTGGYETVGLQTAQIPSHTHQARAYKEEGSEASPESNIWGVAESGAPYANDAPDANMRADSIDPAGGGQAHENRQPYQVVNFCIALQGIYPSRP